MSKAVTLEQVQVPALAWLAVGAAALAAYLVSMDNGLALGALANHVHELFHDGRHFLGVPCH